LGLRDSENAGRKVRFLKHQAGNRSLQAEL